MGNGLRYRDLGEEDLFHHSDEPNMFLIHVSLSRVTKLSLVM